MNGSIPKITGILYSDIDYSLPVAVAEDSSEQVAERRNEGTVSQDILSLGYFVARGNFS